MSSDLEPRNAMELSNAADPLHCVIIENDKLRLKIMPGLGGKIASLCVMPEGWELLQQPLKPYDLRTCDMNFEDSDASGIDECLPSVSACHAVTPNGVVSVPDHGDFWRIPFAFMQTGNEVTLEAKGWSLPLLFRRGILLEENTIRFTYSVENISDQAVKYLWSAHPAFVVQAGDRITLPTSIGEVVVEDSQGLRLGKPGSRHKWPCFADESGNRGDLSQVLGPEQEIAEKIFCTAPVEGWAALERLELQRRIIVRFDPKQSPYLGMWLCYGGWPIEGSQRQQCVALEPCTSPVDSLAQAIAMGQASELMAHGTEEWQVVIEIHPLTSQSTQNV